MPAFNTGMLFICGLQKGDSWTNEAIIINNDENFEHIIQSIEKVRQGIDYIRENCEVVEGTRI